MRQDFFFGKYNGRSVEDIAINNYDYVDWVRGQFDDHEQWTGEINPILSRHLVSNIDDVIRRLNNFIPETGCECGKNIATTFIWHYKYYNEPGRSPIQEFLEIGKDIYCMKGKCLPEIGRMDDRLANMYRIKFDSLLSIEKGYKRMAARNFLMRIAGYEGTIPDNDIISPDDALRFIENLNVPEKNGQMLLL